jgi:hypothetical protein
VTGAACPWLAGRGLRLTYVITDPMLTPMRMVKTQVYLREEELAALHRVARRQRRPVAELVRDAVRAKWLRTPTTGPVALWEGPFAGSSADHDAAFDEP